jgi:hypothetical protein
MMATALKTPVAESVGEVLDKMDERRVENMRIWNALSKTDPAQTKAFKRAGGFSGTAVKPMWVIKRLTEQFGPCGEGWGIGRPHFEMAHSQTGEVLVYCTVGCWHGNPDNEIYGVGGDKVVTLRNDGKLFHDDEAFKKAFTDAVNNAFKFVGVAADIHMGMFDDSKYVAEVTAEFRDPPKADVTPITDEQHDLIGTLAPAAGKTVQGICEAYKVGSLKELTQEQGKATIRKLKSLTKEPTHA